MCGLAALLAVPAATAGHVRKHRPHLPPVCDPCRLTVDEDEWRISLSRIVVAPGPVTLKIYNRGEDDHNLVVRDAGGGNEYFRVDIKTGDKTETTLDLPRGRYEIVCDLFVGTPQSHIDYGMVSAPLVVA